MNAPIHSNEWEMLSAYLDGQLNDSEQARLREMLSRSAELREGLEELRRTRAVLRAAPRRRVPHNFTLTPAMVQKPRPRFSWNWAPALGVASALASVLLVLTFFLQFSPAIYSTASLPAAAPQSRDQVQAEGQNGTAPPIIIWNSVPTGMGGGMGGGPAPEYASQSTPSALSAPAPAAGAPAPAATAAPAMPAQAATAPAADANSATSNAPRMAIAPTGTPAQASKSSAGAASTSGVTDKSGPILGIAATEDRGKMTVPTLSQPDTYLVHAAEAPRDSSLITFRIILAAAAVLTGLLAAFLWWRTRH